MLSDWFMMISPTLFIPITLIAGIIWVVIIVFNPEKPDWIKKLFERLHGDSTIEAPPPDVKKKKRKGK